MSLRTYLLLFLFALIPPIIIAQFQPAPGYLDSDYYFAGGIQLATGKGFTEPYLWNYLDGTTSLPHPSHSYWQPLASIVTALGMWLTGQTTYASGRIFFLLIAALAAPVTAALAYAFSKNRGLAITSGLLAVFSVYHAPFVGVTDNFGIFMLLGGLYFLTITKLIESPSRIYLWVVLGGLAGFMTLARTDGLLWLGATFLFALFQLLKEGVSSRNFLLITRNLSLAFFGFILIMSPWYARNWSVYGSIMTPGGSRALWLGDYGQTFTYPPSDLNFQSFLALGWDKILADRTAAFLSNLLSGFAAHGGILLFPFIIVGIIAQHKDERVKLAWMVWTVLFFVMTLAFPFAGARGAFFHAGAAFQPMWWTLAPLGLESMLASLRKKNWGNDQTPIVFRSALVMIAMILTVFVVYLRLFDLGWSEGEENYPPVEQLLAQNGITPQDVVIVRNAPGYYLQTGRSAISSPYGDEQVVLEVAKQFNAYYLVMEPEAAIPSLQELAKNPKADSQFDYLGEVDGSLIFKIDPQ